jgi:hypothetical protein
MALVFDALDIADLQVLLFFPNDENGVCWHHRLLLVKVGPGRWLAATPDLEIEFVDLNKKRYQVLERSTDFPVDKRPFSYGFDPLPAGELNRLRRLAKLQALALDDVDNQVLEEVLWRVAEPASPEFGRRLTADEIAGGHLGELKGATMIGGLEFFVQKVGESALAEWKKGLISVDEDIRLLGLHRNAVGTRHLPAREGVLLLRESPMTPEEWSVPGVRAAKEWTTAAVGACGTLTQYESEWARRSGVGAHSMVAHIHFILVEAVRLAIEVDQIDISNCQSFETIVRRIIVDETAVARNPKSPDYSGLDLVFSGQVTEAGQAQVAKFNEWFGNRLKDRSNVMRQNRLWAEELRHSVKGGKAKEGKGDIDKKKEKKKKGKGKVDEGEEEDQ